MSLDFKITILPIRYSTQQIFLLHNKKHEWYINSYDLSLPFQNGMWEGNRVSKAVSKSPEYAAEQTWIQQVKLLDQ